MFFRTNLIGVTWILKEYRSGIHCVLRTSPIDSSRKSRRASFWNHQQRPNIAISKIIFAWDFHVTPITHKMLMISLMKFCGGGGNWVGSWMFQTRFSTAEKDHLKNAIWGLVGRLKNEKCSKFRGESIYEVHMDDSKLSYKISIQNVKKSVKNITPNIFRQ